MAALGFACLPRPSCDRTIWEFHTWLDSYAGIGRIAVGMTRQGYDLQLTRYDEQLRYGHRESWLLLNECWRIHQVDLKLDSPAPHIEPRFPCG
jgi:hypothetical protein